MDRSDVLTVIHQRWGWLLVLGGVQIALALLAIGFPLVATLASAVFVGWLLLLGGVVQGVHAFQIRGWKGFLLHALGALLYVVAGCLVIAQPVAGALTLTLVVAAFFAVEGVSRLVLAFHVKGSPGAIGFGLGGALGILLGFLIWLQWPGSAVWAIGLLVGVNLLFSGVALVSVALAARRHPGLAQPGPGALPH